MSFREVSGLFVPEGLAFDLFFSSSVGPQLGFGSSKLLLRAWKLKWCVIGCACTCLVFRAGSVPQAWQKILSPYSCVQSLVIMKGQTIASFSFSRACYKLWGKFLWISLQVSPSHPPCSSHPSHFKLEAEQTAPFSGEEDPAVDYTLPPPLLFVHHLPLYPYPLFSSSAFIPIPWCLWNSQSTSVIISRFLSGHRQGSVQ